jgi:tight adherence protein C
MGGHDLRQVLLQRSARERAVQPTVEWVAGRARRVTPLGMIEELERRAQTAGMGHLSTDRLLASKAGLGIAGVFVGFLFWVGNPSLASFVFAAALAAGGWFSVDLVLSHKAQERRTLVQRQLPDTLDQITIMVESGLGFEAALHRAARTGTGPLAEELARTLQDVQIGVARQDALRRLVDRVDVADLRRFVHAVAQAEVYGVPIAQVLRSQSGELREKRKHRAEEQAMKVPVKIVFPLVLCILPALFVVILGPAAIRLIQAGIAG